MSPAVETADAGSAELARLIAINMRTVWLCMNYEVAQMRE